MLIIVIIDRIIFILIMEKQALNKIVKALP